ncbi:hypothetical protein [Rhizobium sp. SG2393]|uniref:hypothetical protein n=1 Tax=Rhizobium sp. SG2393 TaxID=3276279 RepID=UPI00366DC6A8
MADFVAVIRRTVDGLSENVPEMRAKVYDKARGAVRRQLENMNPRPSDDMIGRQMAKLEQAIVLVEAEHAEALPALDDSAVAATSAPEADAPVEAPVAAPVERAVPAAVVPQPEPAAIAPTPVADVAEPVSADAQPASVAAEPAPVAVPAPVAETPAEPEDEPAASPDAWAAEAATPWSSQPAQPVPAAVQSDDDGAEDAVAVAPEPQPVDVPDVLTSAPETVRGAASGFARSDLVEDTEPAGYAGADADVQATATTADDVDAEHETTAEEAGSEAVAPVASDVASWEEEGKAEASFLEPQHGHAETAEIEAAPSVADEPVVADAPAVRDDLDAFFSAATQPFAADEPIDAASRDVEPLPHDSALFEDAALSHVASVTPAVPTALETRSADEEVEDWPREAEHAGDVAEAAPLGFWPDPAEIEPVAVPAVAPEAESVPAEARANWDAVPAWTVTPVQEPVETPASPQNTYEEVRTASIYRHDLSGDPDDLLDLTPRAYAAPAGQPVSVEPIPVSSVPADPMPADPVLTDPGLTDPMPADSLADWNWPSEKVAPAAPELVEPAFDWDTRGVDGLVAGGVASAAVAGAAQGQAREPEPEPLPDRDPVIPAGRPISYRVKPKRRVGPFVALLLVGVAAVGGGGYAYYTHQQAVNAWASGLIASITANGGTAQTAPPSDSTGNGTTTGSRELSATGSGQPGAGPVPETAAGQTEVASVDPGPQKFTQRLQADGSEIDPGPAALAGADPSVSEGKSVAEKTDAAPAAGDAATQTAQAQTGQTPVDPAQPAQNGTTPAQTTPAAGQAVAALPGEKMFLYEERLGQTTPTAIPGTAAWSVKEESPGGDAKPEPVIQAQITVPDRGLTALMTIKRNADSSLPASHVIEFVFSVPDNFEGGSIDAVQRVAMKRTEQDRGDALIAVPAKITDDFYMIALNDFPEAVTTNLQLLESRSWIDIPITYRNGRRALLTLEKGQTGTQAFNTALQAWAKLPTAAPANGQ